MTDESKIPVGAVISPPDSAVNSSDDEETKPGSGSRQLENLAELQAAVRIMEQQRDGFSTSGPTNTAQLGETPEQGLALLMLAEDLEKKPTASHVERPAAAPRKLGHSRSSTEPTAFIDLRAADNSETPSTGSEEEISDEEFKEGGKKPPMLRKKSGELVRPALRPASARRRPSSMPGTPTFSKAVHFDSHLEHIRHFLQVDKPLAVSAGSSPVAAYDNEVEFPFDESPPFEWAIVVSNFPADTPLRLAHPVRVERVFLSSDNKNLVGSVSVANLAFQKTVVARFTLDYWKTTSEVVAEYNHDVRHPKHTDGRDRFNFNIKLADLANLEAKTMFFCVKYVVNGKEYWDNNNSTNFQIDFRKKDKPRNGKNGLQGGTSKPISNSLPRSHARSPPSSVGPSPKTIPAAFDDFGDGFDEKYKLPKFQQPVHTYLGESAAPLRLKGVNASTERPDRRPAVAGQAFGNRYDFGASLTAAINATNTWPGSLPSKVGVKRQSSKVLPDAEESASPISMTSSRSFRSAPAGNSSTGPGADSPILSSQSYNELLDKYCFFGSARSSPQFKDGTMRSSQLDGSNEAEYVVSSSDSTADNSPVIAERKQLPARTEPSRPVRSSSPAPMTSLVTGTSPMYSPFEIRDFPFHEAYTATAIRG